MAEAIQAQPEPEYGAKVEVENATEAIAATQPAPGVPFLMAEGDDEPMAAPAQPQGFTVKNPYMLLPASVNFPQNNPQKTPVERDYDIGQFWEILAADNRNDATIREIASAIIGKR